MSEKLYLLGASNAPAPNNPSRALTRDEALKELKHRGVELVEALRAMERAEDGFMPHARTECGKYIAVVCSY
jgi:hypothetical protein